jgi:hypothetical protein
LAHPKKKYARDHLCKHKYLSIYTCDTQMMHFWLFRQKHVFCFHSNHSDGDNYCLLLRIGFSGILETCKYQRKCTRVNHILLSLHAFIARKQLLTDSRC